MICSSAPNLSFLLTSSFTLSFSSFSSYSKDFLFTNSVKAASYIISIGVSFSFFNNSDHLDSVSRPSTQSQSGLANDPLGALGYLGLFFFSPLSPSLSLSLYVLFFSTYPFFTFCFFSSLALFLTPFSPSSSSSSSSFSSLPSDCSSPLSSFSSYSSSS